MQPFAEPYATSKSMEMTLTLDDGKSQSQHLIMENGMFVCVCVLFMFRCSSQRQNN